MTFNSGGYDKNHFFQLDMRQMANNEKNVAYEKQNFVQNNQPVIPNQEPFNKTTVPPNDYNILLKLPYKNEFSYNNCPLNLPQDQLLEGGIL